IANSKTLRSQDIAQLTVFVLDQCNKGGPVRIIFDPLNSCRHIELAALEVHQTISLLMTTSNTARGHMPFIITTASLALTFNKRFDGLAFPKAALIHQDKTTLRGTCRFIGF